MRVLSKVSHDDHDLGSEYELVDQELLERFLAGGIVVPASEWSYRYVAAQGGSGDQQHLFTRVEQPAATEVAPAPEAPTAESSVAEIAPAPVVPAAPALVTRVEANPEE